MIFKRVLYYLQLILANEYTKHKVYAKYLGVKFGSNVRITHYPRFGSEPYLISIGDNVTITRGVCFVNHDGSVALFRKEFPGLNIYGTIMIGNNVFIGINTIILKSVCIGNNVIIGAGSLVNRDIPDNCIVAGVPARVIGDIDNFKSRSLHSACYINTNDSEEKKRIILSHLNLNQ